MNIIHDNASLQRALSAYDPSLKIDVRVNGKPVVLNNDNQLFTLVGLGPNNPSTLVIDLDQRP